MKPLRDRYKQVTKTGPVILLETEKDGSTTARCRACRAKTSFALYTRDAVDAWIAEHWSKSPGCTRVRAS
jgi:hypothetical protein